MSRSVQSHQCTFVSSDTGADCTERRQPRHPVGDSGNRKVNISVTKVSRMKDVIAVPLRYSHAIACMVSDTAPIVILDRCAAILWGNALGLRLLAMHGFSAIPCDRLRMPDADTQIRFEKLLQAKADDARMMVRLPDSGEWMVIRYNATEVDGEDISILRLAFSTPHSECRSNGFADQFGLTRTECTVLDLFAAMGSVEEIASRMKIGPATVRSHLKHIYSKTGVSDGRKLMRLISTFDAV